MLFSRAIVWFCASTAQKLLRLAVRHSVDGKDMGGDVRDTPFNRELDGHLIKGKVIDPLEGVFPPGLRLVERSSAVDASQLNLG